MNIYIQSIDKPDSAQPKVLSLLALKAYYSILKALQCFSHKIPF